MPRQRRDEPRDQGKPQQACELLAHLRLVKELFRHE